MLKRIAIVGFFTGSGQLLSVFVLKFISQHSSVAQLRAIAEIDSLVFFIMSIIALGLQSAAMRNLALNPEWKEEYRDTQRARITLGLLLMAAAALAPFNNFYLLFLIAPVLAWNGDYALYARGYPIAGAMIAFTRLAVPFLSLLIAAYYFPANLAWVYVISLTIVYFITNTCISWFFKTTLIFRPSFRKLHLYISSLPLGVVAVSLYFLGLGLILVIPYFYTSTVITTAFLGLKFYVLFKGVLRIIHQAFIKEMIHYEVCFKVDQLCSLIGLTFASFTICFPKTFITLFFGQRYLADKPYFILLAIAGLVYSLFSSLTTRAMLEKRDKPYAKVAAFSALLTAALSIVFSFMLQSALVIGVSLLVGEIVFAFGMLWIMHNPRLLQERSLFLLRNLLLTIIPLAFLYFMGDKLNAFIIAAILFSLVMVLLYHNKFGLSFDKEQLTKDKGQTHLYRGTPENKTAGFFRGQNFKPGFAAMFSNPFFFIRRGLYKNLRQLAPQLQGKLLDFGCGSKPYEKLFTVKEYIGVDMQQTGHDHSNSRVDVFYDGKLLPFNDATFDSLFCSEVLEHIFNPDEILPEINRVLKPGARALITVPFCWNEHEVPFDYARYSSYGITHLLSKHGFTVLEVRKSGSFTQVIFQLWSLYFFEMFRKWGRAGHIISLLFIVPINLAGSVVLYLFPKNESLYFNNIVLAEKPPAA